MIIIMNCTINLMKHYPEELKRFNFDDAYIVSKDNEIWYVKFK